MVTSPIGFFGKVPSKGDFISSNLPASFIRPWDAWLRLTLVHCRERLGEDSRKAFLLSPVWRFILAPGCCGPQAWTGVIASSIDRIGRIYPLTLATGRDGDGYPVPFMIEWAGGFERLIDLALTMLREQSTLDHADAALQQIFEQLPAQSATSPPAGPSNGTPLAPGDTLSVAFAAVGSEFETACATAVARAGTQFSLMWQVGWGLPAQAIIGCGLPDTARNTTIWEAHAADRQGQQRGMPRSQ